MGTTVYAYALLGVVVPRHKFLITKRYKAFEHNYPEDWMVDPKTQKPLWVNRHICRLQDPCITPPVDYATFCEKFVSKSGLVRIISIDSGFDSGGFGLGVSVYTTNSGSFSQNLHPINGLLIDELKIELEELLSPHGLWDANPGSSSRYNTFGLHALMSAH